MLTELESWQCERASDVTRVGRSLTQDWQHHNRHCAQSLQSFTFLAISEERCAYGRSADPPCVIAEKSVERFYVAGALNHSSRVRRADSPTGCSELRRLLAALAKQGPRPSSLGWFLKPNANLEGDSIVQTSKPVAEELQSDLSKALADLALDREQIATALANFDNAPDAAECHPNYVAYQCGGVLTGRKFAAAHVPAWIGFNALPIEQAFERITEQSTASCGCILSSIRKVCESEPELETAGLNWCGEHGLLRNGKLKPFWLKNPKLGLGQPAKTYGLKPGQAEAFRGVFELSPAEMLDAFSFAARSGGDRSFGSVLPAVIAQDCGHLQKLGAAALHADAEQRYRDLQRSFAAHEAETSNTSWRSKPPRSRQGHLAVTTASAKCVAVPSARTRGEAAEWLDQHGANLRFNGDKS